MLSFHGKSTDFSGNLKDLLLAISSHLKGPSNTLLFDLICYDMKWYDMIWNDMIWFNMISYDFIWIDMIW